MITKSQYQILESLINIKKHNSNRKKMKVVFQTSRFASEDVLKLEESQLIRLDAFKNYQITTNGEYEFKNKL